MHRIFNHPGASRSLVALAVALVMSLVVGCDRSPEDLEEWRTARGGMQQLSEWAQDESEPMDVRIRAVQIIIEEGADNLITRTLEGVDDEEERETIANHAMTTVQQMWEVQDFPRLDDEILEEGGEIAPDGESSIRAIEALYHLMPFLSGQQEQAGQEILRDWISDDQVARDQWADVSIPLLVPLAGDGAMELVTDWLKDAHDPRTLVRSLRLHAPEDAHHIIDETIAEMAREKHPDISTDFKHAIAGAESSGIASYLEEVLVDETASDRLYQIAVTTLSETLGEDSAEILAKAVAQRRGPARSSAATGILDARGVAGLADIGAALPLDPDAYGPDDDEFNRHVSYLCNFINTNVERGDFEADPDTFGELLAMDSWAAQTLGLQCVARTESTELLDAVQQLTDESADIAAWGEELTVGQFAEAVAASLDVGDDE